MKSLCGILWKDVLEPLTHVCTNLKILKESNVLIQVILVWLGSAFFSGSFSARRLRKQLQSAPIPPLFPKPSYGSERSHFNVQHPLLVLPFFLLLLPLKDCGCFFSLVHLELTCVTLISENAVTPRYQKPPAFMSSLAFELISPRFWGWIANYREFWLFN